MIECCGLFVHIMVTLLELEYLKIEIVKSTDSVVGVGEYPCPWRELGQSLG